MRPLNLAHIEPALCVLSPCVSARAHTYTHTHAIVNQYSGAWSAIIGTKQERSYPCTINVRDALNGAQLTARVGSQIIACR